MLFDRQILYFVFFFFASSSALPARTTSGSAKASPSSQASQRDLLAGLRPDISPRLISSADDFASRVAVALPAHESGRPRRSWPERPSEDQNIPDLQPPEIAALRDCKDPAVTSSASRRSKDSVPAIPRPASGSKQETSRSPNAQSRPLGQILHASDDQPSLIPQATVISSIDSSKNTPPSRIPKSLNRSAPQMSRVATMADAARKSDGIGGILSAIDQVGALSGADPATATGLGSRATEQASDEPPTNALDVLISALPTSIAAPIQSEYSDIIEPLGSGINDITSNIFGAGDRTTSPMRPQPTTPPSVTSSLLTTSTSPRPTTNPSPTTTSLTSTPTQPTSTLQTRPSDTTTLDPATATPTSAPGTSAANPSKNASTIGIATGVASGVVLLGLGALYLWRRRQQGKGPFARSASKRSNGVYPEVAWLYDPAMTPPGSRSRAGSEAAAHLIPAPRPGSVEIGGTPVSGSQSPEMRGQRSSSPLLMPRGSRDGVGSRSRSGSEVDLERLRPLSAVREESARGSVDRS